MATAEELLIEITGESTSFLKAVDQAKSKTDDFNSQIKNFAKAGVAAFASITAAVGASLVAYKKQEDAEQKVRGVIEATGKAAGVSAEQVFALAKSLQSQTKFSDEAILQGQALLLTFKNIKGEAFEKATVAALDLAESMGGDVRGSALLLGKALNNPTDALGALTRQGVAFSDGQKRLIKSFQDAGELAKAQDVIFRQIDGTVGGLARTLAGGVGAFDQLKNASNDLLQAVGKQLAPEFVALAKQVTELASGVDLNSKSVIEYKASFLATFAAIGTIFFEFFNNFGKGIAGIATVIAGVVSGDFERIKVGAAEIGKALVGNLTLNVAKAAETYQSVFASSIKSNEDYKAALEKAAKFKGLSDQTRSDELAKETQFQKDLKALTKTNTELKARKDFDPNQQRLISETDLNNKLLQLQIDRQKKQLENDKFFDVQRQIFQTESEVKKQSLRAELFEQEFELSREREDIVFQLEQESDLRRAELKNENRKIELAEQEGFFNASSKFTQEQQDKLFLKFGKFGTNLVKADGTLQKARLDIWDDGLGTIQDAFTEFGVKNVKLAKALQISQIVVQAFSKGFGAFTSSAEQEGGLLIGIIQAALVAAAAATAIHKVTSTQFNPGGLATGAAGAGSPFDERFLSTFSPREIVVPAKFSEGIQRGDLALVGGDREEAGNEAPQVTQVEVILRGDASKILQAQMNEDEAIGTRRSIF